MTLVTVVWQSDISTPQIQLGVVACKNDERKFKSMAVMCFTSVGEIEQHRIIEHTSVTFRYTFETLNNLVNQCHVMRTAAVSDLGSFHSSNCFAMTDIMHIDRGAFNPGNAGVRMS